MLVACLGAGPPAPVLVSDGRYVMGTILEITLVTEDPESARETLERLFSLAEELGERFTTWNQDSELSLLNRRIGPSPVPVSAELAELIGISLHYAELTGGSFDVTVGPLVELWRRAGESGKLPTAEALAHARARVGAEHVQLEGGAIALSAPGVSINLGGVAKGYTLDRLRSELRSQQVGAALLSFGQSSTWAVGRPPDAAGWRLLALGPAEDLLGVLNLEERALSVSGSLGQWSEIEGRRYGHVLDPRSGQPLTRGRQALVVTKDASLAEALSTALLVQSAAEGMALVESQPDCEALLADADGRTWRSSGWDAVTGFEALEAGE